MIANSRRWFCDMLAVTVWIAALLWPFPAETSDVKLLFVGNSYTYGYQLDDVVKNLLQRGVPLYGVVFVRRHAPGGWRFEQHRQDAESPTSASPLREYLVTGQDPNFQWNFVLLQEQSQIPGFPQNDPYWRDSLGAFRGLHSLVQKKGAISLLWMTWGRRKGDSTNLSMFPNYKTMQARLASGYRAYATQVGTPQAPVILAPVGLAWERVYDDLVALQQDPLANQSRFSALYEPDDSHPSARGAFLTACVLYAALTGRDPSLIRWDPASLSETDRQYYQQIAWNTVWQDVTSGSRYSWIYEWKEYPWPSSLQIPGRAISSPTVFPLVRLREDAGTIDTLALGATHNVATATHIGDGRLSLESGARLVIQGDLRVGVDGIGEVDHRDGVLQAKQVVLGKHPKSVYRLHGGTLQTEQISSSAAFVMTGGRLEAKALDDTFTQKGGIFSPGPGVARALIESSYHIEATASLEIQVDSFSNEEGKGADLVQVKDTLQLAGTLTILWKAGLTLQPGQTITILRAKQIQLVPGWIWQAPPGVRWQRKDLPDAQILQVYQDSSPAPEFSQETLSEPSVAQPDASLAQDNNSDDPSGLGKDTQSHSIESTASTESVKQQESLFVEEPLDSSNSTGQGCCQINGSPPWFAWCLALLCFVFLEKRGQKKPTG